MLKTTNSKRATTLFISYNNTYAYTTKYSLHPKEYVSYSCMNNIDAGNKQ